jgi:hypothetical protein
MFDLPITHIEEDSFASKIQEVKMEDLLDSKRK